MGLTGQNQPGLFGRERINETERDIADQVNRSRTRRAVHRFRGRWFRRFFRRSGPSV
jgi:hypothetical protein